MHCLVRRERFDCIATFTSSLQTTVEVIGSAAHIAVYSEVDSEILQEATHYSYWGECFIYKIYLKSNNLEEK